ncbi:MAG: mechanosensitive ion channel family protein [Actinomycetota bacterium]|nr:mechanosensitive ion channel family protein [Actinomycetota bacterium]
MPLLEMPPTCRDTHSWTCATVYDWTHNEKLAYAATWLIGTPLKIAWLVILAIVFRWLAHHTIERMVRRAEAGLLPARFTTGPDRAPESDSRQVATRRGQRAKSLGSLMKSLATGVIFGVVGVMILSAVGVDIAPILASAGVLGLAIGFGAQSLVKDFLSGIFMVFEDQYGVGDTVTLGDITGTVEAVSLRVTRMRSADETVWYVRNGEILKVGNQSQS